MKLKIIIALCCLVFTANLSQAYYSNQSADIVIGQQDFSSNSLGCSNTKYAAPNFVCVYESKFIVADAQNHRVLIYNSFPNTHNAKAYVVIGQPGFYSNLANQGGSCSSNTLNYPIGVVCHEGKLIITDTNNNRVLIYNSIPTTHNAHADIVVGQQDFWSNGINQGVSCAGNTLWSPCGVDVIGEKLFVVDSNNNRILIHNSIPATHNAYANVVIGQPDMVSYGQGCTDKKLYHPGNVGSNGTRLVVPDKENQRVLIYNSIPTTNYAPADVVIGQSDFISNAINQGEPGSTAYNLHNPIYAFLDGGRIFICDYYNHRVLVFNSIPTNHNASADMVIGQPDFASNSANQGGNCAANTLNIPLCCYVANQKLIVSDTMNHRILIYNNTADVKLTVVSPAYSIANRIVNVLITGTEFSQINSIQLIRSSGTIYGTNVVVQNLRKLTCSFDLNALPGAYDIQINVGGSIGTLSRGFIIMDKVNPPAGWEVEDLGQIDPPTLAGPYYGVVVGDGDNDDYQELFIANRFQQMSYFNYFNNYWTISKLPGTATGELYSCVVVCDGDGDGNYDLYGATLNNGYHLYEFKSAGWTKQSIGALPNQVYALSHSDGDNDGKMEIYAACGDNHVYQYKKDSSWNVTDLGDSGSQIYTVVAGDGNSDGEFEVYTANIDHNIYQFKYNGSSWAMSTVGSGAGEMYGLAVGDGNRDGQKEVYGANQDGKIYQFKWQIASWSATVVGDVGCEVYDVKVSDGDNDGQDEVYSACADGHMYQFVYTAQWTRNDMGSVQTPLRKFAISDANNDNQFEIYAIGGNNHIYKIKAAAMLPTPTPTVTPIAGFDGKIISEKFIYAAPNPVRGHIANIVIFTNQPAEVSAKLFTTTNREVLSFRRSYSQGKHTERINVSNLANGVYLLLVKAKNSEGVEERVIKKIAIVE